MQYCHKNLIITEGSATTGDRRESQMVEILYKVYATITTLESKGINTAYQDYPGLVRDALLDISREAVPQNAGCL